MNSKLLTHGLLLLRMISFQPFIHPNLQFAIYHHMTGLTAQVLPGLTQGLCTLDPLPPAPHSMN